MKEGEYSIEVEFLGFRSMSLPPFVTIKKINSKKLDSKFSLIYDVSLCLVSFSQESLHKTSNDLDIGVILTCGKMIQVI